MTSDQAKAKYEDRIKAVLAQIESILLETGKYGSKGISDVSDEEWAWSLLVWHKEHGKEPGPPCEGDGVDFTLCITEEAVRDGSGEGLAFHLSIVGIGGVSIGSLSPYNYTDDLWCYTEEDLEARFKLFENADYSGTVDMLERYYNGRG